MFNEAGILVLQGEEDSIELSELSELDNDNKEIMQKSILNNIQLPDIECFNKKNSKKIKM